jgi:ADP-heptose:LPS heptosyltransferase
MNKIVISRTDSIGDVMLTLPMCVWLKNKYPEAQLVFLGSGYTKAIVNCFSVVDEFVDWKEIEAMPTAQRADVFKDWNADAIIHVFPNKEIASLAKKAKIPMRVGTSHRSFHLLACNHRLNFTRKNSAFHEAQLNFELLKPFGIKELPSLDELTIMLNAFHIPSNELPSEIKNILSESSKSIILHPKSQGSAVEWPIEKYMALATILADQGFTVFFTGTDSEGRQFRQAIPVNKNIIDTTGQLSLPELIVLISKVKNLVACSTGPLHIAGFVGIRAIGLFSPRKPIHPGRWSPLGTNVRTLVFDENCETCKKKKPCDCISSISVEKVLEEIIS